MKKRKLLLIVSLVLALTMSLGGTLAYLQDTDEAVNVMTLGNVQIEQYEQERVDEKMLPTAEGNLRVYTQGKPLYPAYFTGSSISWNTASEAQQAWKVVESGHGALDKFVTVKNTGTSAAYVRTLIAYEGDATYGPKGDWIHVVINGTNVDPQLPYEYLAETIEVNGTAYTVCTFTYPNALAAGETSIPSLKQVYMNNLATNEVVKHYNGTYDILVLSQACQTINMPNNSADALNAAFGAVTKEKAQEWFAGVYERGGLPTTVVKDAAELTAAIEKGGNVMVAEDITIENGFTVAKNTALNLGNNTLTVTGEKAALITVGEGNADLTITNGKLVVESTNGVENTTGASTGAGNAVVFESNGNLTMENVQIEGSKRGGWRAVEVYNGQATLTNVDINGYYGSGVNAGEGASVVLIDCDITVTGMYSAPYNSTCFSVMGGGQMTINSGNYKLINNNTFGTGDTHGGWVGIVMNSGGTLTINDGTYTNVPTDGFVPQYERAIIEAENGAATVATVTLNGGTFNPQHNKVTDGYGVTNYPTVDGTLTTDGTLQLASGCTWIIPAVTE